MNSGLVRSIADLSNRWRSRFLPSKVSSRSQHLRRGAHGETLACRFLRRKGYKILYRNFKGHSGGEIDIVCRDNDTLVFVEVKTRTREDFGRPITAVDRQKQKRISRGASVGSGCCIIPTSSFASMSWRSSSRQTPVRAWN